jgi:hypothetical protein
MMSSWKDWPILARVLCVLIPLQALFVIALTIERIVTLTAANHGQLDDDTKIAIVLCLSYLPFTYSAVSAIALENKFQLFSFLVLERHCALLLRLRLCLAHVRRTEQSEIAQIDSSRLCRRVCS